MADLKLNLFGGLKIVVSGQTSPSFASRKAEGLLAYLAMANLEKEASAALSRDSLTAVFWPENDTRRALANLSVVLSSLRRSLGDLLLVERHTIALAWPDDVQLDVAEFEQGLAAAGAKLTGVAAARLEQALSLYTGSFLAGFHLRSCPDFDEWTLFHQERLRLLALSGLTKLATYYLERHRYEDGILATSKLLQLDSLNEGSHQLMMRLLTLAGQRTRALAQYQSLSEILATELGVAPDNESRQLFELIRDNPDQLLTETAPLAAVDIPAEPNRFIGREEELKQISAYLQDPACRLLTITGMGGNGKTRLALAAARQQVGNFLDGIYWLSLAGKSEAKELAIMVAAKLQIPLEQSDSIEEQLIAWLQPREILLIIDNFETHLTANNIQFLAACLRKTTSLRLLITSRQRLNLQSEWLLPLGGLDQSAEATDNPAAALFAERARQVGAQISKQANELAGIQEICQLVAGQPLALELAAGWSRIMTAAEIAREMRQSFALLATTAADFAERHRSLEQLVLSSWQRLPVKAQTLFINLGIFAGDFDREAAIAVAGATNATLATLVDHALLGRIDDDRLQMHPILHEFARNHLADDEHRFQQLQKAHLGYFLEWSDRRYQMLRGAQLATALTEIDHELENIRAAWQFAVATDQWQALKPLTAVISNFLKYRSRYLEAKIWLQNSRQTLARQKQPADNNILVLLTLREAQFNQYLGDEQRAAELLAKVEPYADTIDEPLLSASLYQFAGIIAESQGEYQRAHQAMQRGLALANDLNHKQYQAILTDSLSIILSHLGDYKAAAQRAQEAHTYARQLGHDGLIVKTELSLGTIAYYQKDFATAEALLRESVEGFAQLGQSAGQGEALRFLAATCNGQFQYRRAQAFLENAIALLQQNHQLIDEALALAELCRSYLGLEELSLAVETAQKAWQLLNPDQPSVAHYVLVSTYAHLALAQGQPANAITLASFVLAGKQVTAPTSELAKATKRAATLNVNIAEIEQAAAAGTAASLKEIWPGLVAPT